MGEAAEVAEALEATAAFATGLRLTPTGSALARRLGVHEAHSVAAALKVAEVPLSEGLEQLAATPGVRAELEAGVERARAHGRLPALVVACPGHAGRLRARGRLCVACRMADRPSPPWLSSPGAALVAAAGAVDSVILRIPVPRPSSGSVISAPPPRVELHAELAVGRAQMGLDGALADEQSRGDLTVGQAHDHQAQNLLLAYGQLRISRCRCAAPRGSRAALRATATDRRRAA